MRKKIAIIMYRYPLGVSTMIINTIKELVRRDDEVVLFIDENTYRQSPFEYKNELYSVHLCSPNWFFLWSAYRVLGTFVFDKLVKKTFSGIISFSIACDLELLSFLHSLQSRVDNSFTHIIAIEPLGLALAAEVSKGGKIIYYDMELLQNKSCLNTKWKSIKKMELKSLTKVNSVVIQNAERARIFALENNFDINRIMILPIFADGGLVKERTDYFHKKFNIPDNKFCVIYAGNFQPWAMCHEIIRTVPNWSNEFVLIMHTWNKFSTYMKYFKDMVKLAKDLPIYFSTDPIPYEDLTYALASANIGLLFYRPLDENFTEIAGSSNKFAEYLKACLPVVSLDSGSLGDFINLHGIGISIDSMDRLPEVLLKIKNNYGFYQNSCIRCYDERFSFSKFFDDIYKRLFC